MILWFNLINRIGGIKLSRNVELFLLEYICIFDLNHKLTDMKNLLFLAISVFVVSCTSPELNDQKTEVYKTECGRVTKVEYTPNGSFIYLDTASGNVKYKVNEYMNEAWTLGKEVCDYTGLTKVDM